MTNYREILRLASLGITKKDIASACSCSRNTVADVLKRAIGVGLSYPLSEDISDTALRQKLFEGQDGKPAYKMPDYDYVHREMAKSGVTLTLLWLEYCDQCRETGELPYKSTQFNKYYADHVKTTKATMHINRKPGELLEVDWAGQTAFVVDTDTGELLPAYIFVATLPYSGYSYVEAFLSQDQNAWITAHVNAYNYFGGVTRILVPDNLKTGVEKVTKSGVVLNKTYQEMAEHYTTAVIPARVRSPKDKASVEGSVGIISTWILAAIRNQQFLSLRELNEAIEDKLYQFNHKPFQKKDGSRATAFSDEKPYLLPLPLNDFELSIWRIATVQYNYHISIENQNYSVPYEYIKQKVDVRLTKNTVEILFEGNRLCSHPRLYGRQGQYSTLEAHMPPNHQQYIQWNGERFRKWSSKIGQNTAAVVESILTGYKVEQQGYKTCIALLKLSDKYSVARVEAACEKALSYTPKPSFKSISAILKSGQDKINEDTSSTSDTSEYGFTRGADYYTRRND